MHLATALTTKGHVRRTKQLLFAVFHPEDVYLVDIGNHNSFHQRRVLEIIARTWPDAGILFRSEYVVGLSQSFDEDQGQDLREHGVSTLGEMIDGAFWTPAAVGITINGDSLMDADRANMVLWSLSKVAEQLGLDPQYLDKEFGSEVACPAEANWTFTIHERGCGVYESSADVLFLLDEIDLPML